MGNSFLILLLFLLGISCIKKPIYGIMTYYVIRMIIPSVARVTSFSFNTISLFLLLLFLHQKILKAYNSSEKSVKKFVRIVCGIYACLFGLTFLGTIPLTFQLSSLLQTFGTELVPSILLALFLVKEKDYRYFCNIVCWCALFTALYGIYTYVFSENPIYDMFNTSIKEARDLSTYATGRLGLSSISVGIYDDSIALSLVSLLLFLFIFNKENINKILFFSSLGLTFVNIFLTTQRTAFFALLLFCFFMYFDKEKNPVKKYMFPCVVLAFLCALVTNNSLISDAVYSVLTIFNDQAQEDIGNKGSSVTMRLIQLVNVLDYVGLRDILQGMGNGFTSYYYEYIWQSPYLDSRFYGFESFLLQVLINSGIFGVIVWTVGLLRIQKALNGRGHRYDKLFFCIYLLAILMTNASASFYLFFFLAVLNSKRNLIINCHGNINYNTHI